MGKHGDRMWARWQRHVYHVNSLHFLGFPLPGVSKYGAKLQRNNYGQPSAGRERNIIIKIAQLSVRIAFGQRVSQMAVFASENGEASTKAGQRDAAWWARAIPPCRHRQGDCGCSLRVFPGAKLSARGNSTSCTLTCQQIWEDFWLQWTL